MNRGVALVATTLLATAALGVIGPAAPASATTSCTFVPRTGIVTIVGDKVKLSANRRNGVLYVATWKSVGPITGAPCTYGSQVATLATVSLIDLRLSPPPNSEPYVRAYLSLDLNDRATDRGIASGLQHETIHVTAGADIDVWAPWHEAAHIS